ncbi:NMDA receptor synaptonuclear signaling and neuronal migration factor isoform X2 [Megalops cyprinoides]|uniref:NMDA receptor synaptonuclear signaling and neuronal migration factor isoform X2 n=1 Tax=Megalops cyprinoides TaxID=118141 RepID=UPI001864FB4D|nr:NMDA receptor synaptonuclear signaling and neuronal migration factor isoform X2 [Megalops cyprinoides]
MGTAVSKRKNLRNDAISSVAAKVRAARAFGEYLSHNHPENRNGSDHLLSDTFIGQDSDSPDTICPETNNLHPHTVSPAPAEPSLSKQQAPPPKRRVSLECVLSGEEEQPKGGEGSFQPARVYTITGEGGMLGSRGSKERLELEVLKPGRDPMQAPHPAPASHPSTPPQHHHHHANHHHGGHQHGNHHHGSHHHVHHHHHHSHQPSQPLQSSVSAHNIRGWGEGDGKGGSREDCSLGCEACGGAPSHSQRSLDLESSTRDTGKQHRRLERMCSVDRVTGEEREENINSWFPKENMFSFQTATTTMQAISNFRKHLRMVGSRRMKAQTFADRRGKSFSRSWSDPTPIKPDSLHDSRDSGDLQASCGTLDEGVCDDPMDWEEEREMERLACEGDDFIPPKIMLISSKVPKAEYIPNIIRRDDPSIIPILYDHEHATFEDILEEIEKKLTAYRKGCRIWRMLIFCQGGPGHLYLLKNKVATFAKVEKEEDMSQFWRRLSRFMSKVNPEPNLIHIMGCYVLGNPNGEKLFLKLKNLMRPYSVTFESPLELSAQGKEMIELYFDFRLYRLWKTRQHSKLFDYDDLL